MKRQKEVIRIYRSSDADLKQTTDSVILSARRDITEFNNRGVTTANLDDLEAESNSFADIPTDKELVGDLIAATEARDDVREKLTTKIGEVRNMAEVKWTIKNVKYRTYDFKDMTDLSVNDFFRMAKRVLRVATKQQTDLASEGLTATKLSDIGADITDLDDKIDDQIDAEKVRDMATHDRVLAGNALYTKLDRLASIGKAIWISVNESKYNDYVLDNYTTGGRIVLATLEGNVSVASTKSLGLLPTGAKILRFKLISGNNAEIGLTNNGVDFDGNTTTLGAAGTESIAIVDLASSGNEVLVRNQSTTVVAVYKLEILK